MFFRASTRACSRSPEWTCRAPQQVWFSGTCTSQPFFTSTRTVASCSRAKKMLAMQPPSSATL